MLMDEEQKASSDEFRAEQHSRRPSLLREFLDFLKQNKKWWLLPIVLVLLTLGFLLVTLGNAGPFLYALF